MTLEDDEVADTVNTIFCRIGRNRKSECWRWPANFPRIGRFMPLRFAASLLAAALSATLGSIASACPFCKVAGGEIGNDLNACCANPDEMGDHHEQATSGPSTGSAADPFPLRFGFAAEVSNAYFRHGYMQQDRGVVFQPTLSVSLRPIERGGWSIDPYFVWFNSIHSEESPGYAGGHGNHTRVEQEYQNYLAAPHAGSPLPHYHTRLVDVITFDDAGGGWFETELKPGIVFMRGPLIIDVNLMGSLYPSDFHDTMIELGVRVSYDLAALWDEQRRPDFSLRFNNALSHELKDDNGGEETIIETSLEPTYRFKVGNHRMSVAVPVGTGWSPNGYFQDINLDDENFGYVSLGLKTTVQLPTDSRRGRWFVNAGVTWYRLLADSAIFANGGDEDAVVASVGIGIAF
jgi:hypothetical protein